MLGFLIGLVVGGFVGIVVMALMNAASRADEQMEKYNRNAKDMQEAQSV